jgi:hypothetical protein
MGRDRWLLARDEFSAAATGTSGASSGPTLLVNLPAWP